MQEKKSRIEKAFFALIRAGLWGKDVQLLPYSEVDYEALLQLAEEQSVVGLAAVAFQLVCPDRTLQFKERTNFIFPANQATDEKLPGGLPQRQGPGSP